MKTDLRQKVKSVYQWLRQHVPPRLRTLFGLLLIVGGVFGFLPILGFWMIPLGIALVFVDARQFWRWLRYQKTRKPDD